MNNENIDSQPAEPTAPRAKASFRLICVSKVKKFALEYAKANRAQKFTRVSEDFLVAIEAAVKTAVQSRVNQHPSKGKTLF
jgi:hypothetical protein